MCIWIRAPSIFRGISILYGINHAHVGCRLHDACLSGHAFPRTCPEPKRTERCGAFRSVVHAETRCLYYVAPNTGFTPSEQYQFDSFNLPGTLLCTLLPHAVRRSGNNFAQQNVHYQYLIKLSIFCCIYILKSYKSVDTMHSCIH